MKDVNHINCLTDRNDATVPTAGENIEIPLIRETWHILKAWGFMIFSDFLSNRAPKDTHWTRFPRSFCRKNYLNMHSFNSRFVFPFVFLFCMLSIAKNPPQKFDKWQIFPQSSFVSNSTWYKALREDFHNFPNGVKSESLQVTVKRETPWYSLHVKNMISGSWLAISFSSHDKECDTRHFVGSCSFDQLENENLFPTFSVCL